MLDLLIEGATVADGTRSPATVRPIGIVDGRFRTGDDLRGSHAKRRVDATGLVAAPGFVDIHTHYDAQVFWDAHLTPSSLHGVTTVVAGNCGFSIAPLAPGGDEYLQRMLSRVEGIPLAALQHGVPWSWSSFDDYLTAVEQAAPALNFAALAGHSAIRRFVLQEDCHTPVPAESAVAEMCGLVREAMEAGALGFSSSWGEAHFDGEGRPVPSRSAGAEEILALCRQIAAFPRAQLEFIPTLGRFDSGHRSLMADMSRAGGAPLNWNVLLATDEEAYANRLSASDFAVQHGGRVFALSYPGAIRARVSFMSSIFDAIPGWSPTLALEPEQIAARLADPVERRRLLDLAEAHRREQPGGLTNFGDLRVLDAYTPQTKVVEGRLLTELATERNVSSFDVLCDLAASDIKMGFVRDPGNDDDDVWDLRMASWRDERVLIGASDAGAHVDIITTFDYPVALLAQARDRGAMDVPDAVRLLTAVPASLYGLTDVGRIADGCRADLVLFDPEAVAPGPTTWRNDLPGGAGRLYSAPEGIHRVFVNGVETVTGQATTEARPGRVIRRASET